MADQKIGVILDFKANTSQAKQSMTQLQQLLTQISTGAGIKVDSGSIVSASKAAKELAYHLSAAYNADTGKLDLGKLNASLNSAKANIGDLSSRLLQAGTTGQQAFVQLAKSMSMAEAPAFKLNGIVTKLWTSLKNVATWQISSSILMGFTSSISEAYQFAQDLNESLNEIRIVTGSSAEEMQRFAKEANKAAKALSTTTTKYTDASLIYFQQGLSEKEVKERTDLTIKMANVTGQSVSEVSDQLTSVWNNFDNGTKALEYYVDVMTALGAATASSSEEISEGLNKFAAVAETAGLSYEYAAAALATVTATTRQSADIVGTAFKTLFARIQDLELGETLDDGTTMGQYSQALAAVGINIKDINGEIKDMNIILDEMGAKWSTLSKDTQIALAQNVAGVRQYTQLIALMDNWSYFQENLNTAYTSTGELQKQADIYAESWEAARNRVTASLEDVYQDVLKDDFFIDLLNSLADIIEGTDTFIEKLGGIEPIIIGLSSLLLNSISNKIQPAIYNIISSIRSITPTGAANEAAKASKPMVDKIDNQLATGNYNQSDKTALQNSKQLLQIKNKLWIATKDMTEAEKQMAQIDLELLENEQSKLQVIADTITKLEQEIAKQEQLNVAAKMQIQQTAKLKQEESELQSRVSETKRQYEEQLQIIRTYPKKIADAEAEVTHLNQILSQTKPNTDTWKQLSSRIQDINAQIETMYLTWENAETVVGDNKVGFGADYEQAISDLEAFRTANENTAKTVAVVGDAMVRAYQQAGQEAVKAGADAAQAFEEGRTKISLSRVSKSFFAQNQSSFADLDINDDLEATRVGAAKTQIGTLQDMLGSDVVGQVEGLSNLFNDAEMASSGQELQQIIEQIKAALDAASVSAESFEEAISDFGEIGKKSVAEVKKPITELNAQHQALVKKQQELNIQAAKFNPKHYASGTEVFAKMTSGITSTVMALNGLNAIAKQLKENGPPDSFDEWMSIITSLIFVAPQLVNAYKAVGGALTSLYGPIAANNALMATQLHTIDAAGNKIPAMTVAELYNAAAKKAGAEATEEQIKAEIAALAVSQGLIDANSAEAFSENILTAAKQKGTIWSKLKTAADNGSRIASMLVSIAKKKEIISINEETGAVIVNTAAWYANPIMWIAGTIALVGVGLAALTIHLLTVTGVLGKQKSALEIATENYKAQAAALEELNENLEEANNKLNEVKETLEGYYEIQNAFDGLVQGSSAWNENLNKNNELVSDLLKKYPELASSVKYVNGVATLPEWAQQYIVGNATIESIEAQMAATMQDVNTRRAKNKMDEEADKAAYKQAKADGATLVAQHGRAVQKVLQDDDGTANTITIGGQDYKVTMANGGSLIPGLDYSGWTSLEAEIFDNILDGKSREDLEQEYADTFEIIDGYKDVFGALYDSAEQRINQWGLSFDAIRKKYEEKELELLRYSQVQNKLLASQMLVAQQGFSELNLEQQQAATAIIAQQLNFNQQMHDAIASGSMEGMQALANQKNVFFGDWSEDEGMGVSNLLNTNFGLGLIEDYLKTNKGIDIFDRNNLSSDDGKLVYESDEENGEDIIFEAASVFAAAAAEYAYSTTDFQKVISEMADITSSVELAKYTGDFTGLSEAEMASIGTKIGGNSTGYDLSDEFKNDWFKAQGYTDIQWNKDGQITSAQMNGTLVKDANQLALLAEGWANVAEAARNYDYTLYESLRLQQEQAKIDSMLAQEAEKLGIETKTLELYMENIQKEYKASAEAAAKTAVANAKYSKGVQALGDTLNDNLYILNQWKETGELTAESAEALTEVIAALKDIFGVEVSSTFVQENLDKIQALTEGGDAAVEAMKELEEKAAKDYVLHLALEEDYKTQLNSLIETLTAQESSLEFTVGVNGDISQYNEMLAELLNQGLMTVEEMQGLFNSFGWSPQIKTEQVDGTPTETISQSFTGVSDEPGAQPTEWTSTGWSKIVTYPKITTFSVGDAAIATPKTSSSVATPPTTSSSGSSKKKTKSKNDEIERYHEIKEKLSDIENELNAISKAKDRAFGGDKLKLMDAELKKTEEMIRAQEQYLSDIRAKAKEDQAAANAVGLSTDASGRISNYDEAFGAAIDKYNAAVEKKNKGLISDEAFEKAEEEYENFIKVLEQYEETLNLLEQEQEKLIDLQNQMADQALEKIAYEVEIKVKVSDNELKALERMLKKLDDPINNATDAIKVLSAALEENIKKVDTYADGIKKIFESVLTPEQIEQLLAGDFSVLEGISLTDKQISQLEDYRDSLYDTQDAIDEFYGSVMEQVNNAFESHNEEAEKSITKIERLTSTLDTYQNIIDLIGYKALGMNTETLKALSKAKVDTAQAQLESLQTQLKTNEAMLESSYTALEQAQTDEEKEYWQKQIEMQEEKVEELKEAVNQSWVDTLQAAADDFALAVEITKTAFEEAMAGIYGTFEKMQEAYAQQQEAGDRYLDTYKQVYELSKLNRDLNKSIDETNSIKGKQALRDLQEEINRLQESDAEMSQYDLDYLRKKYDLRVAEIALEEAQNAKSQVRMQRDAEGNWGYVYTADESKTADAAQNYEDKLYAIQELSSGYIDDMEEKIIQTEIDMAQKLAEIRREDYATEEEYQKAIDETTKYYTELRSYYISEMQKALGNNKDVYENDWLAYSNYSKKVLDADNGWKTQFSETFIAQRNGYTEIEQDRAAFESATTTMASNLATAFGQWQSAASLAFETVGKNFKDFGAEDGEVAKTVDEIVGKLESIGKEMDTWGEDAKSNFKKITDAAAGEFTAFSAEIDKYIKKSEAMTAAINEALKKQAEAEGQEYTPPENKDNPGGSKGSNNDGGDGPDGGSDLWSTEGYSKYNIKQMQKYLGVEADGIWGTQSQGAATGAGYQSFEDISKGMKNISTFSLENPKENSLIYYINGTMWGQLSNGEYAKIEDIKNPANQASVEDDRANFGTFYNIYLDKIQTKTMDELSIDDENWTAYQQRKWNKKIPEPFRSGGYTGEWGSEGRIAMLHQKELVLNAEDTANMLSAIQIIRDISRVIDLRAAAQTAALSAMSSATVAPTSQVLQQEVTIHAEFPNATQRTEIEAAFDTLLNRASQFANRKN